MLPERFWSKITFSEDGCWLWNAAKAGGYGVFRFDGHQRRAHRLTYEALKGSIPDGLDLDHLCRVRHCVNPDHLEPVIRQENLLRSPITIPAMKSAQTECVNGHEFTPENTRIRRGDGTRHCRECQRQGERKMNRGQTEHRREYMRQLYLRRKAERAGKKAS